MTALGVETDDYDDLEVGCAAWSRTRSNPTGMVGGTVIEIIHGPEWGDETDDKVKVVVSCSPSRGPETREIAFADIEMALVQWDTRNAGIVAGNLLKWLSRLTDKIERQRANASEWRKIADRLQEIADAGLYTPRAEARYQAHQAERRRARAADAMYEDKL